MIYKWTGKDIVADKTKKIMMAIDATGFKEHNSGQWMSKKWKTKHGFVKMHAIMDMETQKIIAMTATNESVGDSTMFDELFS